MNAPATQDFVNFYETLGLAETADDKAIKQAIREQRQIWNKRAAQANPVKREQAQKRVRDLGEAERVLLDPSRRPGYDQWLRQYRPTNHQVAAGADQGGRDWLSLARDYFQRGNAPSAYYCAREAIAKNGGNHEAWAIRANSSFTMGNYRDAGFEFREAISLKPDSAEYHFDYAEAFAASGALNEAMGEYEAALRLEPGNPLYRTAIANISLKMGDPQRALSLMEDVVREYPNEQVFQYYLALAIEAVQLTMWSRLRNGSWIITSPAQIDMTRQMSGRALQMTFDDEPLRRSLQENLTLAERAAQTKFFHGNLQGYGVALLVGLVLIAYHGLGILVVAAVIGLYVLTHRMPVWKHNAQNPFIVHRGI
jgi:tetratricopeptide (TPR) repeat protein